MTKIDLDNKRFSKGLFLQCPFCKKLLAYWEGMQIWLCINEKCLGLKQLATNHTQETVTHKVEREPSKTVLRDNIAVCKCGHSEDQHSFLYSKICYVLYCKCDKFEPKEKSK